MSARRRGAASAPAEGQRRVVGVALGAAAVERLVVRLVELGPRLPAAREVGVGDELATDDDGVVRQDTLDVVGGLDFPLPADARLNVQLFERTFFDHDPDIVPKRNEKDYADIPDEVKKTVKFHFVETVDQALALALVKPKAAAKPAPKKRPKAKA